MLSIEEATQILRETRKRYGVSQAELAERAGLKRSAIADIELGRRKIQIEKGAALWDALMDIQEERRVAPSRLGILLGLLKRGTTTAAADGPSTVSAQELEILEKLASVGCQLADAVAEYMAEQTADAKTAEIARLQEERTAQRELHGGDLALIARFQPPKREQK